MLGVAVVGLGVGEQHAAAYVGLPGCRLLWAYDLDPIKMNQVIDRLGAGNPASSFDAILQDPDVDLVSIASYDQMHHAQVVAALRAGKHVFVEKPLCQSALELGEIHAAWRASGRLLRCNLILQAAPAYRWLRDAIARGELGDLYAIDGDYLYGRLDKITTGWRSDVPNYSVMVGGGIHLVDLMVWLSGDRPDRVATVGNRIVTRDTTYSYFDFMAATFTFKGGLVGRITANFGCVHRHQHVVRVFGSKGTFIYDDCGPRLHAHRQDGAAGVPLDLSALPCSKGDLIPAFVAAIVSGADLTDQTQHDLDVMSACLAADRAVASGTAQHIDYLR